LSVEILAAVVLVGGLVDLALLLLALHPGRDSASGDRDSRSVAGGRADVPGSRGRRRTLFVAAAGDEPHGTVSVSLTGSPRTIELRREPMAMIDRLPAVAAPSPVTAQAPTTAAALPVEPLATTTTPTPTTVAPALEIEVSPPAPAEEPPNRVAVVERGPAIVARMNLASQAFGVADPDMPLPETPGVEDAPGWARIVEVEGARLLRYRRPVTALIAEVDGLARLVDRLGEEPVRRLLVVVGDMFRREARSSDWVATIAPGRYAVLLTETDEGGAAYYAERVRRVCEPWLGSAAVPLALAMGWSGAPASSDLQFALQRAEERMHADRRAAGRITRRLTRAAVRERATDSLADTAGKPATVSPAGTGQVGMWTGDEEPGDPS
jgi:GGDEF domain-containing protein